MYRVFLPAVLFLFVVVGIASADLAPIVTRYEDLDATTTLSVPAFAGFDDPTSAGQWPATAGKAVMVTSGRNYKLPTGWCQQGSFEPKAKPAWAHTAVFGVGGVKILADGTFRATGAGFLLFQWWNAEAPWRNWITSIRVEVKVPPKGTHNIDNI